MIVILWLISFKHNANNIRMVRMMQCSKFTFRFCSRCIFNFEQGQKTSVSWFSPPEKSNYTLQTSRSEAKGEKGAERRYSDSSSGCLPSWYVLWIIVLRGSQLPVNQAVDKLLILKYWPLYNPLNGNFFWMTVYWMKSKVFFVTVWDFKQILLLCIRKVWRPKFSFMMPYLALHKRFCVDRKLLVFIEMCNWMLRGWTCIWLEERKKNYPRIIGNDFIIRSWRFDTGDRYCQNECEEDFPQVTASDLIINDHLFFIHFFFFLFVLLICCVIDKLMSCI